MMKGKRAFTLVEVLVGLLLFTIGILALLGNLPWLISSQKVTEMHTVAGMLAERSMEFIKSDPDYNGLEAHYNDTASARRDISQYPAYKAALNVVMVPSTAGELKKITVMIFWYSKGQEKSFTLINLRKRG